MGLAGAKKKRRIGDDPNNTKWARDTNTFGQKILRSHGWQPGQYLGPKDASHAEFHTKASAAHIKTTLRPDNLGIGAKVTGYDTADECTGLDMFKDLLGRLNGKSETVIEKEQKARADVRMTLYAQRRFGPMRFVRGGLLVGDNMQEINEEKAEDKAEDKTASTTPMGDDAEDDEDEKAARKRAKKEKKERKEKKEKKDNKKRKASQEDGADEANDEERKREKKSKRRRREEKDEAEAEADQDRIEPTQNSEDEKAAKKKSKKEKKEKKKEKKERKERRKEKKEKRKREDSSEADDSDSDATPSDSETTTRFTSTPSTAFSSGRHLARRRFIAQKRASVMDPQALKQIFMIKA